MTLENSQGDGAGTDEATAERALAVSLFKETWSLLDRPSRTPREDDRMIHAAHASRLHWDGIGTDQERAVGEWLVSRVYATLGHGPSAVFHARRAISYAASAGVEDWVPASAHEGLARAYAASGQVDLARAARDRSRVLLEAVADPEDRDIVARDFATLPI